jgi:hypothetical protein
MIVVGTILAFFYVEDKNPLIQLLTRAVGG